MSELNQRQNLVLLFTDLSDSTRIAAKLEPEQYADLLQQLRSLLNTIVPRHGGEIVRIDGDGALCIFGYPLAYEDAGRRATEAALDLHAATAELAASLGSDHVAITLHSGIHAGVVLLRSGDVVRGRYEMLGDATNVAARLCDAAGADGILVSDVTLGSDRHFFCVAPQRQIALSGHGETLSAWPVTGREALPHRFATREKRGLTPFVGREAERGAFGQWLRGGPSASAVILIHGPAGIGKSRVLSSLEHDAAAAGWQVARGYCESYLGARPLQPFLQIADGLRSGVAPPANPAQAIADAVKGSRLVLFIDDWQWADDASLDLLSEICLGSDGSKLRIVLFSRNADSKLGDNPPVAVIALPPLSAAATSQTVKALLPAHDPFVLKRIETAAGGSPLLIEELCHAFGSGAAPSERDPRGAWFDLAVQARFARLEADEAQMLRHAAVIGHFIPTWLLAEITGGPISGALLDRLQEADFLYPGDTSDMLRFKHGLTRDAVYAGIGLAERKALHGRVADQFLDLSLHNGEALAVDALAYHLAEAGRLTEALPFAIQAGDAALAAGALDRAQAHYRAAFGQIEQQPGRADMVEKLRHIIKMFGRSSVIDPGREHVAALKKMLALAETLGDYETITLATYWIGAQYYGLGEPRQSLGTLKTALAYAERLESTKLVTQIHANLGQSNAIACRYRDAIHHMDLAIADKLARHDPDRPSTSLAYCISSRGFVRADMGEFAAAFDDFDQSVAVMAGADDPIFGSLDTQRSLALIYNGQFERAAEYADASEDLALRSRSRFLVHSARALREHARWKANRNPLHFDRFVEATMVLQLADRQQRISYKQGWIAEEMAERGEEGTARLFASLAFKRALKGDRLGEASAARALAKLAAKSGGRRNYQHYLAHADRAARIRLSPREAALNTICEAQCLKLTGQSEAAQQAYQHAQQACAHLGMERWLAF